MPAAAPLRPFLARVFNFWKKARPAPAAAFVDAVFGAHPGPAYLLDAANRLLRANARGELLLGGRGDASVPLSSRLGSTALLEFLRRARVPAAAAAPDSAGTPAPAAEILLRRAPFPDLWFSATAIFMPPESAAAEGHLLLLLTDISRLKFLETIHREFTANVSHDLRTPVAILKGYADTLASDYSILDDDARSRFVARIHENIRRLSLLLEDMLLLANFEESPRDAAEFSTGALNATLRDAAEMFADRAAQSRLVLHLDLAADDSATPVCVPKLLNAAANILENAIRHGGAAATAIRISSRGAPASGVAVEIADDGAGVAENDIGRVFDRFFRADKSRSREKGSGLGLSIVRRVMELHGGTAAARPNLPRGFVVRLEFPLAGIALRA